MELKETENNEIILEEKKPVYYCDYDTVVLSGGAAKCILTLGALQYAVDNFLLKNVTTFIGTSAGSMISYLLAIGYSPIEIIVYICTHQLIEKMQNFNIVGMTNGSGAISFSNIQEQLEKMTIAKIGILPTLKELQTKFGKTFICSTYNLSSKCNEHLSPDTHPHLPCLTAIRMSSNLPLIFENYKYGHSFYIDGGISDNFPIDLGDKIGNKVLGILLVPEEEDFNNDPDMNIIEYIYKLMYIPINQGIEYKIKHTSGKCKILKLSYPKLKVFNFNIDSPTKLSMFSAGYNQAKELLE